MRIVQEANKHDLVTNLIDVASEEYPKVDFVGLKRQLTTPTPLASPSLSEDAWKPPDQSSGVLEQIIGNQPTFLPISFLETGLVRSRAVVRIEGSSGLGSGFLVRGNLLVTNHHVLPTVETARSATVLFNYQKTSTGADACAEEGRLDPDSLFETSPTDGGDDWTVVRISGNPEAEWGCLELVDVDVEARNYVNIIQHPAGMPKQIALYHNVVAFADDSRVQYLTDTMPGSSGSPVFDSQWRVVALHSRGGYLPDPATKEVFFRNEGIHVRVLIRELGERGLLATSNSST